jgi:CheY-like chemotaxis protein
MSFKSVLILENDPADLLVATSVVEVLGIDHIHAFATLAGSQTFLESGLRGEIALPDAMIIDLDLGHESGFELLRFWRMNPPLESIPVIVWTALGAAHYREMCEVFRVHRFLGKWEGQAALRDCLISFAEAVAP